MKSPDETKIETLVERLLFETPQGQQYVYERMTELFQAVQQGQATQPVNGGHEP